MSIPAEPTAQPAEPAPAEGVRPIALVADPAAYGRAFWFTYVSNSFLMVAITLLFRYADFITSLGGGELDLGWIVGVGMIGSLIMRLAQAVGIDRLGPRVIWLGSLGLFVLSLLGHLAITSIGVPLYLLRIAYSVSIAGVFGASITIVSRTLALARMAEVIGMLGTSGFLAMALGPVLGDLFFGPDTDKHIGSQRMFLAAAALGICSLVLAALATHGEVRPVPRRRPPLVWLLRRYHPGTAILIVGIGMGIALSLPGVFLAKFADAREISGIAGYFMMYSATALAARLVTRRFPSRFGTQPLIHLGMAAIVLSLICYLPATRQSHLIVPGVFAGIAHALMFPAVIATGSAAFPNRYRGLGNTLMLAMFDVGALIGAPLVGGILTYGQALGLPAYPTMFVTVAVLLAAMGLYYAVASKLAGDASR